MSYMLAQPCQMVQTNFAYVYRLGKKGETISVGAAIAKGVGIVQEENRSMEIVGVRIGFALNRSSNHARVLRLQGAAHLYACIR
jgi:hypothetical protein